MWLAAALQVACPPDWSGRSTCGSCHSLVWLGLLCAPFAGKLLAHDELRVSSLLPRVAVLSFRHFVCLGSDWWQMVPEQVLVAKKRVCQW